MEEPNSVKVEPGPEEAPVKDLKKKDDDFMQKQDHQGVKEKVYIYCGQCEYKGTRQENFRRHYKRCHSTHTAECDDILRTVFKTPEDGVPVAGPSSSDDLASQYREQAAQKAIAKKRKYICKLTSEVSTKKYYDEKGQLVRQVNVSRTFSPHLIVDLGEDFNLDAELLKMKKIHRDDSDDNFDNLSNIDL